MSLEFAQIVAALISFGLGVAQTFCYLRVRKTFNSLPIVSAEIIGSRLLHQLDLDNKDLTQAIINFKYNYQGNEHESSFPRCCVVSNCSRVLTTSVPSSKNIAPETGRLRELSRGVLLKLLWKWRH